MKDEPKDNTANPPSLIVRIPRVLVLATLFFAELSVKLTAGLALVAFSGIKKIMGKNPER